MEKCVRLLHVAPSCHCLAYQRPAKLQSISPPESNCIGTNTSSELACNVWKLSLENCQVEKKCRCMAMLGLFEIEMAWSGSCKGFPHCRWLSCHVSVVCWFWFTCDLALLHKEQLHLFLSTSPPT